MKPSAIQEHNHGTVIIYSSADFRAASTREPLEVFKALGEGRMRKRRQTLRKRGPTATTSPLSTGAVVKTSAQCFGKGVLVAVRFPDRWCSKELIKHTLEDCWQAFRLTPVYRSCRSDPVGISVSDMSDEGTLQDVIAKVHFAERASELANAADS